MNDSITSTPHHAREDVKRAPIWLWAEDCFVVAQKQQEVVRTRQQYAGQGLYCVGELAKGATRRRRVGHRRSWQMVWQCAAALSKRLHGGIRTGSWEAMGPTEGGLTAG